MPVQITAPAAPPRAGMAETNERKAVVTASSIFDLWHEDQRNIENHTRNHLATVRSAYERSGVERHAVEHEPKQRRCHGTPCANAAEKRDIHAAHGARRP